MMKKAAVSTILKGVLHRAGLSVHRALFRHMVKTGLVLCAGPLGEEDHDADADDQDVQTIDDAAAAGDDDQAQSAGQGDDDEEVVITIGDEAPPAPEDAEVNGAPAPQWLRDLRKSDREKSKKIRELEQAAAAREAAAKPTAPTVGEKPTLESCDYDGEVYAEKLLAWNDAKRAADELAAKQRKEHEDAQAAWNAKLTAYNASKAALKVEDFDGAEHVVRETMDQTQIGIMLNGADKPELLVYALGRNPAKAKELATIKDPIKFAFAVAKLETQLKVAPRKTPPAPERQVRGTAAGATSVDNTLARLEAEADKSGDRSKVIAYRREQRRNAA